MNYKEYCSKHKITDSDFDGKGLPQISTELDKIGQKLIELGEIDKQDMYGLGGHLVNRGESCKRMASEIRNWIRQLGIKG